MLLNFMCVENLIKILIIIILIENISEKQKTTI